MRQLFSFLMIAILLLAITACAGRDNAVTPVAPTSGPEMTTEPEMTGVPTADRNVAASSYTYSGNFSGEFYVPGWDTSTIFWNATNGVGNKTLWYRQLYWWTGTIDLYYRDKNTSWGWRWFDQLRPTPYWKTRSIYVGSGTVQFMFVLTSGTTGRQFHLKMVQ